MGSASAIERVGLMVVARECRELEEDDLKRLESEDVQRKLLETAKRMVKTMKKGQYWGQKEVDPYNNIAHRFYLTLESGSNLSMPSVGDGVWDELLSYLYPIGFFYLQDKGVNIYRTNYRFFVVPYISDISMGRCVIDRIGELIYGMSRRIEDLLTSISDNFSPDIVFSFVAFMAGGRSDRRIEYLIDAVPNTYLSVLSFLYNKGNLTKRVKVGKILGSWRRALKEYVSLVHEDASSLDSWKGKLFLQFTVNLLSLSSVYEDRFGKFFSDYAFEVYKELGDGGADTKSKYLTLKDFFFLIRFMRMYEYARSRGYIDKMMQAVKGVGEASEELMREDIYPVDLARLDYAYLAGYYYGKLYGELKEDISGSRMMAIVKYMTMNDPDGIRTKITVDLARLSLGEGYQEKTMGNLVKYLARWLGSRKRLSPDEIGAFIFGLLSFYAEEVWGERKVVVRAPQINPDSGDYSPSFLSSLSLGYIFGGVARIDMHHGHGALMRKVATRMFSGSFLHEASLYGDLLSYYTRGVKEGGRMRIPEDALKRLLADDPQNPFAFAMGFFMGLFGRRIDEFVKGASTASLEKEDVPLLLLGAGASRIKELSSTLMTMISQYLSGKKWDEKREDMVISGMLRIGLGAESFWKNPKFGLNSKLASIADVKIDRDWLEELVRDVYPEAIDRLSEIGNLSFYALIHTLFVYAFEGKKEKSKGEEAKKVKNKGRIRKAPHILLAGVILPFSSKGGDGR